MCVVNILRETGPGSRTNDTKLFVEFFNKAQDIHTEQYQNHGVTNIALPYDIANYNAQLDTIKK